MKNDNMGLKKSDLYLLIRFPNCTRGSKNSKKYYISDLRESDMFILETDSRDEVKIKLDLMGLKINGTYSDYSYMGTSYNDLWLDYKTRKEYFFGKLFYLKEI